MSLKWFVMNDDYIKGIFKLSVFHSFLGVWFLVLYRLNLPFIAPFEKLLLL